MAFKIDPDYKEVSERIDDLYAKHPAASLSGDWHVVEIRDKTYIAYRALCFREPNDPSPSVGTAWEEFPGRTPYTQGSELQNAETSAWGRAIVAAGASRSKRIASADEMRSAQARQQRSRPQQSDGESTDRVTPAVDVQASSDSSRAGESRASVGTAGPNPAQSPAVPATSKNRVGQLQAKLAAMQAHGFKVYGPRTEAGLPLLNGKCTDEQLDAWAALLDLHDNDLTSAPV